MLLKRHRWMSREDHRMLQGLPLEAAREMEKLLYNQAHSDRNFRSRHVTGGVEDLERMAGERASRSSHGTGGGRVRRPRVEPS